MDVTKLLDHDLWFYEYCVILRDFTKMEWNQKAYNFFTYLGGRVQLSTLMV